MGYLVRPHLYAEKVLYGSSNGLAYMRFAYAWNRVLREDIPYRDFHTVRRVRLLVHRHYEVEEGVIADAAHDHRAPYASG